jgi:hypothetical protein
LRSPDRSVATSRPIVEGDQTKLIRAREATTPTQDVEPADLARRLREIREEVFGEQGVPPLAEALHLSAIVWRSDEAGAEIPGPVLIRFVEISGASLLWLLTGEGDRFPRRARSGVPTRSVAVRGRS